MTFDALHKRVTYLFAALGYAALSLGTDLGPVFLTLFAIGFVTSWYVESPRVFDPRLGHALTAFALGSFAVLGVVAAFGGDLLELGLGYTGLLQLTRLFHRRTSTEHLHVVGLGFLHLLAGTLLSTGLDYAAVFVGFVIVTPWMLSLTHLRAEMERKHAAPAELEAPPTERLARVLASRDVATRGMLALSSALSLPLFAITAAFFLLFPRVGLGMFTLGEDTGQSTAGFGSSVDLGGFGTIRDDPTVVARVFPPDLPDRPPAMRTFRLRGTSFDRYDGVRWTRSSGPERRRESAFGPIELFGPYLRGRVRPEVRLVVASLENGVVFLPEGASAVRFGGRIERGIDRPRAVRIRPGLDVRVEDPDGLDLDYVVSLEPEREGWPEELDAATRARLLAVPPDVAEVAELAADVVGTATDERMIAERILRHLRDSGAYGYSLTRAPTGDANPLVQFLFSSRAGHCELFATAMAVMLRARGIPARNVTGFLGGTYNEFGRYYALRQGDAHSWVEAYVDGRFVTFDPTPPARAAFAPPDGAFAPLRAFLDAMRVRWARDVIGYDMRRQLEGLIALRDRFRAARGGPRGRGIESAAEPSSGGGGTSSRALPFVALGIGLAAVIAVVVRRRRAAHAVPLDAAVRLYRTLEDALAARGLARPSHQTPTEHAAALRAAGYLGAATVDAVTSAYAAARYGGATLDAATHEDLGRRVRALPAKERDRGARPVASTNDTV